MICIKNGTVYNAVTPEGIVADILVENGKIKEIGPNLSVGAEVEIIDATGKQVYPGFVEAHGHIGLDGYGIGYEGMDYNEMNDIVSPQLRGLDGVKAMDPAFAHAAKAGVTCVCVGPGSANVLGGTFTTIKTVGKRVDDTLLPLEREEVMLKAAQTILEQQLSVRQTESLVKHLQKTPEDKPVKTPDIYVQDLERAMASLTGHKITIHPGAKKGKITIEYYGNEDLEAVCEALKGIRTEKTAE